MTAYERELLAIETDLETGQINIEEYNKLIQDLERSCREEAKEAAMEAYEDKLHSY